MMHELAHVALNAAGICDLRDSTDIETFCNRVAGATIFPRNEFLQSKTVREHRSNDSRWSSIELKTLSRSFGGSREAALVRLLVLNLTSQSFYEEMREELRKEYERLEDKSGFVPPHKVELSCAGGLFTSTVIDSLDRNNITLADASSYLHIGFKHMVEADRAAGKFEGGIDE